MRFNKALRHATPSFVHHSELGKCKRIPLLSCFLKPEQRHVVTVWCALPERIERSKVDLSTCMSQISGLFEPILCLKIVLWKTSPFAVQYAHFILSVEITGLSTLENFFDGRSSNECLWRTKRGSGAT